MSAFYQKYHQRLKEKYPSLSQLDSFDVTNLASPLTVPISQKVVEEAVAAIRSIYKMTRQDDYIESVKKSDPRALKFRPPNNAVLMAYDFHIDDDGHPRLIEINTNASGYLFCNELYEMSETPKSFLEDLQSSFQTESAPFVSDKNVRALIIDENLPEQKMFFEFLMYRDLLNSWGWKTDIVDVADVKCADNGQVLHPSSNSPAQFVYNRFCDFKLVWPESQSLAENYFEERLGFSPNPFEYTVLADKQRLMDWSDDTWMDSLDISAEDRANINQVLIPTKHVSRFESKEQLWSLRKRLFFKPKESFGGKATYRGKNISKKVFERIVNENTIAQGYVPAPVFTDSSRDGEPIDWKYDVRFYVYQDQVQMTVARLYQGQVTNFNTSGGGFARVRVV